MKIYWIVLCVSLLIGCSDDASSTNNANNGNNGNNDWDVGEDTGRSDMADDRDMGADMTATDMSSDMAVVPDMNVDMGPVPVNHRPAPITCDNERPEGATGDDPNADCNSDADCTEGANGRCVFGRIGLYCSYDECFEDSGCDGVCECGGESVASVNHCVIGNCAVDADCENGYCSPSFGSCGDYFGVVAYYCHTAKDECLDDAECTGTEFGDGYCAFDPSVGKWACSYSHCAG